MSGIGELIAAAREERGMTVVDAARRLHIRAELIQAIEKEDWGRVGPPSYARGFVRNYARLVGADAAGFCERLDAAIPRCGPDFVARSQDEALEQSDSPERIERSPAFEIVYAPALAPARSNWYPWLLGAMSMLAAVLVIAVLYYTFAPSSREQVAQSSTQIASAPSPAPQDDAIFNGGRAGDVLPAGQKAGVDLQLQLTQDSWLSVTVDGKRVVYETLPAGTVRVFHGAREIALRAGNAGGVTAVIDGRPLGTLGQHGQVEERVFAAKPAAPSIGPRE